MRALVRPRNYLDITAKQADSPGGVGKPRQLLCDTDHLECVTLPQKQVIFMRSHVPMYCSEYPGQTLGPLTSKTDSTSSFSYPTLVKFHGGIWVPISSLCNTASDTPPWPFRSHFLLRK